MKREGNEVKVWEWGWVSTLVPYFSFLREALCRQKNRYGELIALCTIPGGAIHDVTHDTEYFPVRNLPYLKSGCLERGIVILDLLGSSYILNLSLCWMAPIHNYLFREFII